MVRKHMQMSSYALHILTMKDPLNWKKNIKDGKETNADSKEM